MNIKIVKQVLRNAGTLQLFQISGCCTRPWQNHHHMSDLRLVVLEERVVDAERHHGNTILTKFSAAKTPWKWLRFHIDVVNNTIYVCKTNELFSRSNQANAINPNLWPSTCNSSAFITKYVSATKTHFQRKWKLNLQKANPLNFKNAHTPHAFSVFSNKSCPREQPQALPSRAQHQQGAEHSGRSYGAMPLHCQPASGKPATSTHKLASVGTNGKAQEWNRHSFSN